MTYPLINDNVAQAISAELQYQISKYGANKPQSFPGWMEIIRHELQEAADGWCDGITDGRNSPIAEIVQVAAVAIACLNYYGTTGCPMSTNDIPPSAGMDSATLVEVL